MDQLNRRSAQSNRSCVDLGSCFGIFFGGEDTGTGQTIRTAVQEINQEYMNRIDEIKQMMTHDKVETTGSRAAWKEVLAV